MGEWIEHDGKGMPVSGDTFVDVKFRDGGVDEIGDSRLDVDKAYYWYSDSECGNCWLHGKILNANDEIVAYRVVA